MCIINNMYNSYSIVMIISSDLTSTNQMRVIFDIRLTKRMRTKPMNGSGGGS